MRRRVVVGRLRGPADFAAVSRGPWRAQRRWLAAQAAPGPRGDAAADPVDAARIRLGLIVARRFARRAVDRNLVKRLVREALRAAGPALASAAQQRHVDLHLDLVLRLKAPLPPAAELPRLRLRRELRGEVDALLTQLATQGVPVLHRPAGARP